MPSDFERALMESRRRYYRALFLAAARGTHAPREPFYFYWPVRSFECAREFRTG
jgi:hypothetical protein